MKKGLKASGFCFTLVFVLFLVSSFGNALAFPPSEGYMHSADYYAVSFDGEGDAIARAKLIIENTSERPINEIVLQMPENSLIYYIVQETPDFNKLKFSTERSADYLDVKIRLANEIKEGGQASIVIIYKVPHLAKKDLLGNFNFEFKTLIDKRAILTERVRVAVNVQPGFYLKGAKSEVNYKPDFFSEMQAAKIASESLPHYYKKYYNIEYARGLVKQAYSLDQFESFTVRGTYSENLVALYWLEILSGTTVAGAMIIAITLAAKKGSLRKKIAGFMQNGFLAVIAVSILDALALLLLSFLLTAVGEGVFRYVNNPFLALLFIFIVMVSLAITMLFPAYWVYKKHSVMHAIATVLLTLAFLFAIIYAYSVLFYKPRILYGLTTKIE
ncbi:MAG: hypothetical protein DRO07_01765 [Candidatus Iainarchaeum archaeon]|uniref:Uncharacterized protein n=1 Tax=Candidatus Iainarchaeum sp. TaxID=3101447 RepID=A0A497JH95_9ARCH|nr:MAG: hypothetical protein DRO07_01765 [Candidatus Diapherotrites archaeon]